MVVPTSSQQRSNNAHVFCRLMVPAEEVILTSECNGAYLILRKIVVKQQSSVFKYMHHIIPSGISITDRLTDKRTLAVTQAFGFHPLVHFLHQRFGAGLPFHFALFWSHSPLVTFMLYVVKLLYFAKEP